MNIKDDDRVIIDKRYLLIKIIHRGKNSIVYDAIDLEDTQLKIVLQITPQEKLVTWKRIQKLSDCKFDYQIASIVPKILYRGSIRINQLYYYYHVIQKCGPSLKLCFRMMKKRLSIRTVTLIALKMVQHLIIIKLHNLQVLHGNGLIHRNLKPSCLLSGKNSDLFMTNFDQCSKIIQELNKINLARFNCVINKYSSLGVHLNQAPSIKDDLESLLYIVINLLTEGTFLTLYKKNHINRADKMRKYYDIKLRFIPEMVLRQYPEQFSIWWNMIRAISNINSNSDSTHPPNYDYLRQPLLHILKTSDLNLQFDWIDILNDYPNENQFALRQKETQSARNLDMNDHDTQTQKSAPASPGKKPKTNKNPVVKLKHLHQKKERVPTIILPPILEMRESQPNLHPYDDSSSGNLSSEDETHINESYFKD